MADSGMTTVDAGEPPIWCGASRCDPFTQICCATSGMTVTWTCTASNACAGSTLTCSSAADCSGGDVCCGNLAGTMVHAQCQAMCSPEVQLCASTAECENGFLCLPQGLPAFSGLMICR